MRIDFKHTFCLTLCGLFSVACTDNLFGDGAENGMPISLMGDIKQNNVTRASDYGFVSGDRMGVYIVDYENNNPGTLAASGNRASNVLYTFDGEKWDAPLKVYWRDNTTPVDVYGYYPGMNAISDPAAYRFEVSWQQNVLPQEGEMSNYEASDLLWGKKERVSPTTDQIKITYHHQLAGVNVTLVKGEGFANDEEWNKLEKTVQVDNTVRTCDFNLQTAAITLSGNADRSIQMLPQSNGTYRAVVIPQTIEANKSIISLTIDGKTYNHVLTSPMKYEGGKMHNFTLTIRKSETTGGYEVSFANNGISDWVNDEISHSFSQNQFVVIECSEPGKLKESITAAGYDYNEMKNLKVKGQLTTEDFYFMRDEMSNLTHLNLYDVRVKDITYYDDEKQQDVTFDDVIPEFAFHGNKTIRSLTLPSKLNRLNRYAFSDMQLMYTTFVIPEGVTSIDQFVFSNNDYNGVELVLPYSLESIGAYAFLNNGYSCEFKMTDNLKHIGEDAFSNNNWWEPSRMHGVFHVPSKLKEINKGIFRYFGSDGSFTGEIEIPQGITSIGDNAFSGVSFKNRINFTLPQGVKTIERGAFGNLKFASLTFNDDLEEIQGGAFYDASIPFQITLPSKLRMIGEEAFFHCGLEGELIIPENCLDLGINAFASNNLTSVTLPSKIEMISKGLFAGNSITSVTIPKYVSYIGRSAFACENLQTVVCQAETPPNISEGDPFDGGYDNSLSHNYGNGVAKDKCVLEVPEKSVELYRNTPVWKEFKNITAHHELACNISKVTCMEKGITREGIVRSEGEWEAVCPDWITVSPSSSTSKKTEITITVNANSGAARDGKIVFKLKNKEYTTYTEVKQVSAKDGKEDQRITLQTATMGSNAIPLFLVGEGYDAEDIASGKYLDDMRAQMDYFFSIEPLKSYRYYFTVSTAIACSPESGIDGLRKFASEYGLWEDDCQLVLDYARQYGVDISGNEKNATILVLRNSNQTGENKTNLYYDNNCGLAISWMAKSEDAYPFDQKGFILHELAGIAFGKLGPEHVGHFTFLKACQCPGCNMKKDYEKNRSYGWWQNVSNSNKLTELPWYHLIFDEKYAQIVDAYEGALNHSRGAYRSENVSVMGNQYIPYFNTISREILVKRIMEASGGTFSFDTFKQNDKIEIPE